MTADGAPIFVTGASGFIGGALLARLHAQGVPLRVGSRSASRAAPPPGVEVLPDAPIEAEHDWRTVLAGCTAVMHTAARVHVMDDSAADPLAEYRRVNVQGTLRLARHAAEAGVKRFVFVSSIKVNGERTRPGRPFTAGDAPAPSDPYGVSKREAEDQLLHLAAGSTMDVVIVRPVLVYGPGVKGNFLELMRWLKRGVPLPLGAVANRRSLLGLDNLVDLLGVCLREQSAANQVFLASDDEPLSTTELLRRTAAALQRPARLLPVPPALLRAAAAVAGRAEVAHRLLDWLEVDISKTRRVLNWSPPVSVDAGLRATARWFVSLPAGHA